MKWTITCPLSAALFMLTASALSAQVNFEGSYTQDFDSLPEYINSGSGTQVFNFTNNINLPGWYSTSGAGLNEGRSSGGAASASGYLYNWGRTADRALGIFNADGYGGETEYFGVQLLNNTGATISDVNVSYVIEQWRRNTNATTWSLQYLVTAETDSQIDASGYTTVSGSTIQSATGSAAGSNGDWHGNQTDFDLTISGLSWEAGEALWLRWSNTQPASGGGFGVDDLAIQAIPEANSSSMLIMALFATALLMRRKLRA